MIQYQQLIDTKKKKSKDCNLFYIFNFFLFWHFWCLN